MTSTRREFRVISDMKTFDNRNYYDLRTYAATKRGIAKVYYDHTT